MQWSNIGDKKSFLCWTVHLNNNSNNKMLWEEADLLLQHNKDLFGKKFREKCKKNRNTDEEFWRPAKILPQKNRSGQAGKQQRKKR